MYTKIVLGIIAIALSTLAIKNLDIINSANAVVDHRTNYYGMDAREAGPMLGEIRLFAGSYVPEGWALCDGEMLAIDEYRELYKVIGTIYGGDAEDFFALPDLRGRAAVGSGADKKIGRSELGASKLFQSKEIIGTASNARSTKKITSKAKITGKTTLSTQIPPSTRDVRTGNLVIHHIICVKGWMPNGK